MAFVEVEVDAIFSWKILLVSPGILCYAITCCRVCVAWIYMYKFRQEEKNERCLGSCVDIELVLPPSSE